MKMLNVKFSLFSLLMVFILLVSCESDPITKRWKVDNFTSEDFTVLIDGDTRYLDAYEKISGTFTDGCVDIDVYNGYAGSSPTYIKGTLACSDETLNIYNSDLSTSGGSGGSTGSGGSGNTGSGRAMFWTSYDLGCGNVTVNCSGNTRTISSYYSSGTPSCGASGCATFTLTPGTYTYSASCNGGSWNNSFTVTDNGCAKIQLTL